MAEPMGVDLAADGMPLIVDEAAVADPVNLKLHELWKDELPEEFAEYFSPEFTSRLSRHIHEAKKAALRDHDQ